MGVDRRGTRLQPERWGMYGPGKRSADRPGRGDARVLNEVAVVGRVATIHTPTGKIDHDIRPVKFRGPSAEGGGIPRCDAPGRGLRGAAQNNNVMPVTMERTRQQRAHLTSPTGDDNF